VTRDVIVISLEAWDTVWRRNQHLVSGLLRDDPSLRVLFVEPPADPVHAARRRNRPRRGAGLRAGPSLEGVDPGRLHLYQGTKALPRRVDPHADQWLADQVVVAADRLGFDDPLLWLNDPAGAALLERTGWRALYDVTDDWLHAGHTGREHERLVVNEARLLRDADYVVVCSPALLASKSQARGGRPVRLVPNAVDIDAYQDPGPRPADLPDGPVALYVGTVHRDRVDLELCARTARSLAGRAHAVLVGPAPLSASDRRRLENAGVLLLGARDARDIPAYLTHADVLLVPHVVTPFTDSLDPIKLYEYRAANRPVVSTRVAGFRDTDDPRVILTDPEDFPETVLEVVRTAPPTGQLRKNATPETPSWAVRTLMMRSVLDDVAGTRTSRRHPTVAIAHDYLTQRGGAERVVLAMHRAFPDATIYTTLYEPGGTYPEFRDARIVTSPLNEVPQLRRHHRSALPLLPFAARSMHITEDVVLASSSGWAHGFSASGRRLVYCHAPARWLYQAEAYLGEERSQSVRGIALLTLTPWLKRWDKRHALAADAYLANSRVVRDRMRDAYGIEAPILPPPHAMDPNAPQESVAALDGWRDYHLVVSRLMPYKNVEAVVEAFRDLPERLVVVGQGPLRCSLERRLPPNVRLLSDLSDAQLRWVYAHSQALVGAALEDYGLTPLEAAAYGKPTIALGAGGYLDTVVPGMTGLFFDHPSPLSIRSAVVSARRHDWSAAKIRAHAVRFSEPVFRAALQRAVAALVEGSSAGAPTVFQADAAVG
jgi:glycosyltransferase involved in cell wall biosynthesis